MKMNWNPNLYDEKHDYVFKYGEEVVSLLDPKKNETILDLGCGTGELTKKISERSKTVIGLDSSSEMIQIAKEKYPDITFVHSDGRDFKLDNVFDAVFSNAALHWIPEADKVIQNINKHLQTGGRLVAEFGGKGNINRVISTIIKLLDKDNIVYPKVHDVFYYPSISQYSSILEKYGFEVNFALLFDRPTVLKGGEAGLNNFIEMFLYWLFVNVSTHDKMRIIKIANDKLKSDLFNGSTWIADYRRIRIVAKKK